GQPPNSVKFTAPDSASTAAWTPGSASSTSRLETTTFFATGFQSVLFGSRDRRVPSGDTHRATTARGSGPADAPPAACMRPLDAKTAVKTAAQRRPPFGS